MGFDKDHKSLLVTVFWYYYFRGTRFWIIIFKFERFLEIAK